MYLRVQFVQCMNYGPTSQIGDRQFATKCAKVVGHGALRALFGKALGGD